MASSLWITQDQKTFWAWAERPLPARAQRPARSAGEGGLGAGSRAEADPKRSAAHVVAEEELERSGFIVVARESTGDGATFPQEGDRVCISYVGRIVASGALFDAARHFSFEVGSGAVVAGLDQAVASMSLGEESQFVVHHSRAYGGRGAPAARLVPPFANLLFRVHLLGVQRPGRVHVGHPVDQPPALLSHLDGEEDDGRYRSEGRRVPPCASVAVRPPQRPSRHETVSALARSVARVPMEEWLRRLDGRGTLARYGEALVDICGSVERLVGLYGVARPDGSTGLAQEFFSEVGVERPADRHLFQRWFEQR